MSRQCELLEICRSGLYYRTKGEDSDNEQLTRLMDEQYTATPFYGYPRMTAWLRREGHLVNKKRVAKLMNQMGLQAVFPKPNLSKPSREHRVYPYLLRGVEMVSPNPVWSTDITYIRLLKGLVYLLAIIDWFSRYVLSWELSTTMETEFCRHSLEKALRLGTPEIFNSDPGSQFTSSDYTSRLLEEGIAISMDGRGRALDNIFVERLWRSLK